MDGLITRSTDEARMAGVTVKTLDPLAAGSCIA